MASQNPNECKTETAPETESFDNLVRIHGTGRMEAAKGRQTGRHNLFVHPQAHQNDCSHSTCHTGHGIGWSTGSTGEVSRFARSSADSNSFRIKAEEAVALSGKAHTKISVGSLIRCFSCRNCSLSRLFTLFRTTADPTFLPTWTPRRETEAGLGIHRIARTAPSILRPARNRSKSRRPRNRSCRRKVCRVCGDFTGSVIKAYRVPIRSDDGIGTP
jgi:hypothetical protein